MDRWIDGWMDGWIGWMDGWMDGGSPRSRSTTALQTTTRSQGDDAQPTLRHTQTNTPTGPACTELALELLLLI